MPIHETQPGGLNTLQVWEFRILNQVSATREQPNTGHIHFSMAALMQNRKELTQRLQTEKYQSTALVPESPWLARKKIAAPEIGNKI